MNDKKYEIKPPDPIGTLIKMQHLKVKLSQETKFVVEPEKKFDIDWIGVLVFLALVFGAAAVIKLAFYG